ncbi:MAG: heme-binding domain-containing protein [Halobacteriovoraceae bacterium]|nr:heme-binding domain-containing protein [Halobacteriovoraceae bacterium]
MKIILIIVLLCNSNALWAHGGVDHTLEKKPIKKSDLVGDKIIKIKESYFSKVEPIFKRSCFDCHSNKTDYPWYYSIPLIDKVIDHHISDAKSHLDFSFGYPFKSHDTKVNDLKSIRQVISKGHMPPWYYLLFHNESKLNEKDVQIINQWIKDSIGALE